MSFILEAPLLGCCLEAYSGFAMRKKLSSFHLKIFVTPGGLRLHDEHLSSRKNTKLSHRSCQTAIEAQSPGRSQTSFMTNFVMYYGIIVEVREALGATFVCSTLYTTAENTGYTNATFTIRTIKTPLCHKLYIFCAIL